MSSYSFRFRFLRSFEQGIEINSNALELLVLDGSKPIILYSHDDDTNICASTDLFLEGSGWSTEEEASLAGKKYKDTLLLTLARLSIGIDFGNRASSVSFMTQQGLNSLQQGTGQRMLNDTLGLIVYESNPAPHFISSSSFHSQYTLQEEFEKTFTHIANCSFELTSKERLALEVFHASFFQQSIDARFLLLVTAIEALIETRQKSNEAVNHINNLIQLTIKSNSLDKQEKDSLVGSLGSLRQQSISQAGRELAATKLGERTYMNLSASEFFRRCYDIRSRLVHGYTPPPSVFSEVGEFAAPLRRFVSDILCIYFFEPKSAA